MNNKMSSTPTKYEGSARHVLGFDAPTMKGEKVQELPLDIRSSFPGELQCSTKTMSAQLANGNYTKCMHPSADPRRFAEHTRVQMYEM